MKAKRKEKRQGREGPGKEGSIKKPGKSTDSRRKEKRKENEKHGNVRLKERVQMPKRKEEGEKGEDKK